MLATFKTLFVRPAARTSNVRLTVQTLEAREVPADIGWVMAGPQPDPPATVAVSTILAPFQTAVQALPPRPAIGALVAPAPGG